MSEREREEKQQIRAFFCYVNLIERTFPWRRQANSINWNNLVLCFFCEEFMEGNKIQINTEKAEGPFCVYMFVKGKLVT